MKNLENPNFGSEEIKPIEINPTTDASHHLVEESEEKLKFDSITPEEEVKRLKEIYETEDGKFQLLKDLKSTEFALMSEMKDINSRTFKELYGAYTKLIGIYETVFNTSYKMQLNKETGVEDYTEEIGNIAA